MTPVDDRRFCAEMLPNVSRTFAACIRLLPPKVENAVLIAYLLCRIADTIEDTADLPVADKERLLAHFRACLDDGGPDAGRQQGRAEPEAQQDSKSCGHWFAPTFRLSK